MNAFAGDGDLNITAAAGTKIRYLVPPNQFGVTRLTKWDYTTGGTAHVVTVLRPIGKTAAGSTAGAGATSFTLAGDPGPAGNLLAANDIVAIRETDGVTRNYKVVSYAAGTLTIGADNGGPASLVAGVAAGTKVWDFGVEGDTDPYTGRVHPNITVPLSSNMVRSNTEGMTCGHELDSPLLWSSANGTNAGTLNGIDWSYTGQ
jgi:hypothetical protein